MSENAADEAFARYVQKTGMASAEQIEAARKLRISLPTGVQFSLADALVKQGSITAAQREAVEKKLDEHEGISQLGPYKLMKKLGEGGMGTVYLAEDTGLRRKVALKVLPKRLARDAEFLKRFLREAEAVARLDHVNIVRAYAAGEDHGFRYYAMEYCEGESLRKRLDREEFLSPMTATEFVIQVARGLNYAHENGIIHRDIKPENVVVTPKGEAKILDLGLSKNLDETERSFKTVTGQALGTPHYMSPEQARGEKTIDGRTDIYSLGATYYHLLTGEAPFQGSSVLEIIAKSLAEPLTDPRDIRKNIPEDVVQVLRRMMAKAPNDRYQNCGELIAELERLMAMQPPESPKLAAGLPAVSVPGTSSLWPRKGPLSAVVIAGAVFITVMIMILHGRGRKTDGPGPGGTGETEKPRTPTSTDGTKHVQSQSKVELLKLMKPDADSVIGKWHWEGEVLVSDKGGDNTVRGSVRVLIPYAPPEEYDLEIEAERTDGNEDLIIGLVFKGRQIAVYLDGWGGQASGFFESSKWVQAYTKPVLNGGKKTILCEVRRSQFTLRVDGQEVMSKPDSPGLGTPPYVNVRSSEGLIVGSVRNVCRITRLSLKEITGSGKPLKP